MANQADLGWLHRPPKIHPIYAFILGLICIPVGMMIQGGIGGGLVGGGIASLLVGAWDAFRLKLGMVHKTPQDVSDRLDSV